MVQITKYTGLKNIYFNKILLDIIQIANLNSPKKKVLDYGCGEKQLQKLLKRKIFNYDINPKLNEIENINKIDFDIIVMNHVLMYLSKKKIYELFDNIKLINPNCEFIIGIGKQNFISKIAKNITFNFKAHSGSLSTYQDQLEVIKEKTHLLKKKKNIYFMTDIFYTKFN